jgi:uncharacterized protein
MTHLNVVPGPRDVFARMQEYWLTNTTDLTPFAEQLADDVVIEAPFAPPGRPKRVEGREQWLAMAAPGRAALPARFEACRTLAIHDTADPEVIVVEYELAGTVLPTNQPASARFVGVLRVRDGKVVHWREYQDTFTIAHALGQC